MTYLGPFMFILAVFMLIYTIYHGVTETVRLSKIEDMSDKDVICGSGFAMGYIVLSYTVHKDREQLQSDIRFIRSLRKSGGDTSWYEDKLTEHLANLEELRTAKRVLVNAARQERRKQK
jgi:hypothetical protein